MNRQALRGLAGFLCLATLAVPGRAETLTYTLTPQFDRGVMEVELEWETRGRRRSAVFVPPQAGQIDDVAAMLTGVRTSGGSFRREGSLWGATHREGATLKVSYTVDPRTRTFDWENTYAPVTSREFFMGLGKTFLLTPSDDGGAPAEFQVILRWKLPAGADAVCSWGAGRSVADTVRAEDLRDSAYLAGELEIARLERGDRRVTVAMPDRFNFSAKAFAERAARIVDAQVAFMRERDFPDLVITAVPVGEPLGEGASRLSGTGLYHGFALWIAPQSELNDAVEHLFAHELFHYWNGRMLEAAMPDREVYWFIEGFTDYYALRILYESGYWSAATYAKWINKHLREYAANPAKNATNAEIRDRYWTDRDTYGQAPYQRGLLLGLRWRVLARTQGKPDGLDTWFHKLIDRGRTGMKLTNREARKAGEEALGPWFAGEFDRFVVRADTLEVSTDALGPKLKGEQRTVYAFEPGFDWARSLQERRVIGLKPDSAAARAGLREGDELTGWRLRSDPDEEAQLQVRRGGKAVEVKFFPRGRGRPTVVFEVVE